MNPLRCSAGRASCLGNRRQVIPRRGAAGRVFEANEGAGSAPLRAFSPHGLSEGTEEAAAFYADRDGFTFEKFVIPNPFGPYEEPRFTIYLMKTRLKGEVARVQTPGYVRDNIRVSLLAKSYAAFVGASPAPGTARAASARAATRRVKGPLPSACAARLRHDSTRPADSSWAQTEFLGPAVRINTDLLDAGILGWSEAQAWDELVAFYARERSQ
jgi:UDP-glucose 4-epimerase